MQRPEPRLKLGDCSRTIADLRRELAECKAERDAALAREVATAEVLHVINSSSGDLAPVFDAMLDRAIRLCEATHGHLFTYDGERFHSSAARGDSRYIERARQAGPVRPYPNAPLGQHLDSDVCTGVRTTLRCMILKRVLIVSLRFTLCYRPDLVEPPADGHRPFSGRCELRIHGL
jgi:hypothetical protein